MKYTAYIGGSKYLIEESDVITFSNGIPGFPLLKKFTLVTNPNTSPLQWLSSLEDKKISFPVIDPWIVRKDYVFDLSQECLNNLAIEDEKRMLILSIVNISDEGGATVTVNLLAPIIINLKNNLASQIILDSTEYEIKHDIREEMKRSGVFTSENSAREDY